MDATSKSDTYRVYIVDGLSVCELYDVAGVYGDATSITAGRLTIDFKSVDAAEEFELRCRTHRLHAIREIERFE